MKTFSSYIKEARDGYDSREDLHHAIKAYLKIGEIVNPEYKELKYQATNMFEKALKVHSNFFVDVSRNSLDTGNWDEDISDLSGYFMFAPGFNVSKIQKRINNLKKRKPQVQGVDKMITIAQKMVDEWRPAVEDFEKLKGMVVKTTTKRAQAKELATKAIQKKFRDSESLIKVLESHLDEYKEMARKRAIEFIEDKLKLLEKAGWDLDKLAPRPKSSIGREAYARASQNRAFYSNITKAHRTVYRHDEPDIRVRNKDAEQRYINDAVKGAEDSYRAFMQKMIEKIGKPVEAAKMTGSIWTDAKLTVTTNDGEEQVWNTKMILNFSKYQRMFNQFPSRRKK